VSCDDICSKSGGIKKQFCIKKYENKLKRAEQKALKEVCEAKKSDLWSRIFHKKKGNCSPLLH